MVIATEGKPFGDYQCMNKYLLGFSDCTLRGSILTHTFLYSVESIQHVFVSLFKVHPKSLSLTSYIPSVIKKPLYWFHWPLIHHTTLL